MKICPKPLKIAKVGSKIFQELNEPYEMTKDF